MQIFEPFGLTIWKSELTFLTLSIYMVVAISMNGYTVLLAVDVFRFQSVWHVSHVTQSSARTYLQKLFKRKFRDMTDVCASVYYCRDGPLKTLASD